SATLLPIGTTEVIGSNRVVGSESDFFEFLNLVPNQPFTLTAAWTGDLFTDVGVHNSSGTLIDPPLRNLGSGNPVGTPVTLTGLVPSDGILIFEASGGGGVSDRGTPTRPGPPPAAAALS